MPNPNELSKCMETHTLSRGNPTHVKLPSEGPCTENVTKDGNSEPYVTPGNRASARVKTRILEQPYERKPTPKQIDEGHERIGLSDNAHSNCRIMIIEGPGLGHSFDLSDGFVKIGRGDNQEIQLSGDDFISRANHAIIGFVPEGPGFAIFDGGKANRIWVNNTLLSGVCFLDNGDIIRIGETSLRFMAC